MLTTKARLCILVLVSSLAPSLWGSSFPSQYDHLLRAYAQVYLPDTDWRLLKAQCYQESRLNPSAVSPVGASGLCQFMPGTWRDMQRQLGISSGPFNPVANIRAAAYYMSQLQRGWSSPRPDRDRYDLALASYNAGFGNLLAAQRACNGAVKYAGIIACLPDITGRHSEETINYVRLTRQWHQQMRAQ